MGTKSVQSEMNASLEYSQIKKVPLGVLEEKFTKDF
jgi:hypothetical protein